MLSQPAEEKKPSIRILRKKKYSALQKMFCCRFLHCCQADDQTLLTSKDRKTMFMKLALRCDKLISAKEDIKPFHMLMALLIENGEMYSELMEKVTIHSADHRREDLEFYIPQLCTYLVFHEQMQNRELIHLLQRACKLDLHFSHRFYFYLNSLSSDSSYKVVQSYIERLSKIMTERWKIVQEPQGKLGYYAVIDSYNNRKLQESKKPQKLETIQVKSVYKSIYRQQESDKGNVDIYNPTISFMKDLVNVAERVHSKSNKREFITEQLRKINLQLPSRISLPLFKNSIREKTVLGIVFQESRVFTTKERSPYSICLEVFTDSNNRKDLAAVSTRRKREDEHGLGICQLQSTIQYNKVMTPRGKHTEEAGTLQKLNKPQENSSTNPKNRFAHLANFFRLKRKPKGIMHLSEQKEQSTPELKLAQQKERKEREEPEPYMNQVFGESGDHRLLRVSRYSPYSNLPGYELVNLIVKYNDNLKQQQFAMQLVQNFQDIFVTEGLPLKLYAYEIVSLSPNSGIIEFMQDCLTIDELIRRDSSIQAVIKGKERVMNFVRSLAAYSLITYLLQVKDRHNGNIMLCRDGSIRHIDYGFFISNSPGKGVQIERNVPFKLPADYVRVLGGPDSKYFNEFRKLFYQGFNAARKHQDRILILVNLMYSSHGATMPCFEAGQQGIQQLERRFNPESITSDIDLSLFCQNLINASIDNWRARWYDKWQYLAQGILY